MIQAGLCICPRCGGMFKEAYYNDGKSTNGVLLNYTPLGKYHAVSYPEPGTNYEIVSSEAHMESGLPDYIEVRNIEGNESEKRRLYRYCPKCRETQTALVKGWGTVPTFVVCVVGNREQGKTSLLSALSKTMNLCALGEAGYENFVMTTELHGALVESPTVTVVDSLGATQIVSVTKRNGNGENNNTTLANILFRDVAGELFDMERDVKDHPAWDLIAPHDEYPGPDAFLFVHSAAKVGNDGEEKATAVYNLLNNHIRNWPVCGFVLTHLDEIKKWTEAPYGEPNKNVTILDQETFLPYNVSDVRYYSPQTLLPRMKLEDMLAKKKFMLYAVHRHHYGSENAMGFLVKSCESIVGTNKVTYDSPVNVMDPIIYILNKLGLLDISCDYGGLK